LGVALHIAFDADVLLTSTYHVTVFNSVWKI